MRAPEPLPVLDDRTRFLVSSAALLANIHIIISVHLDRKRLLRIQKEPSDSPDEIRIPQHLSPTIPEGALRVESVERTGKPMIAPFGRL